GSWRPHRTGGGGRPRIATSAWARRDESRPGRQNDRLPGGDRAVDGLPNPHYRPEAGWQVLGELEGRRNLPGVDRDEHRSGRIGPQEGAGRSIGRQWAEPHGPQGRLAPPERRE